MTTTMASVCMKLLGARRAALPVLALALVLGGCATGAATAPAAPTLDGFTWDLAQAFDARGQPEQGWRLTGQPAPQLSFQDGRLNVQKLCNVVGAGYTASNGSMTVSRPVSTLRACPESGLMALERRVMDRLPQASRYEIRGAAAGAAAPTLLMQFNDGSRWELSGTPTAATRFGSKGERVFMEVAAARVPCPPAGSTCLYVRDLRFDEQGLRQGTGEWRVFQGEIEGYRHEPGIRNVLRLQRYPVAGAQAPAYAYVLDLVVESEAVR